MTRKNLPVDPNISNAKLDSDRLARHAGDTLLNGIMLAWGGTLVSFAMHQMELNRLSVVKTFDRWSDKFLRMADAFYHLPGDGGVLTPRQQEFREKAYARITREAAHSKESFWRILGTRALALCAAISTSGVAMYMDPKRKGLGRIEDGFFKLNNRFEKFMSKTLKRPPENPWLSYFSDGDPNTQTIPEKLVSLAVLEVIVGGYSSVADYMRYKSTRRKTALADAREEKMARKPVDEPPGRIIDYTQAAALFQDRAGCLTETHARRLALSRIENPAFATATGGI